MLSHMVLVISMAKNADVLVTGLWGCGAFSHPVTASLRLWKQAKLEAAVPKQIHFCYSWMASPTCRREQKKAR